MSIIFGLFYRNGKPVTDELELMFRRMKHFPHEKHAFIQAGNCGFGHMLTYNTPEARNESMPVHLKEQSLLFAAEGRVDNREELFTQLHIPLNERTAMPDGSLILAAYLHWGETCVDRIMGKWSFAAFDEARQSLFIARDKMDYSDVEYYIDNNVVAFATSSKGLFGLPFVDKVVDELMLARLLVVWPGEPEKSIYHNIRRLLPSHTLTIMRGKSQLHQYWSFEDISIETGRSLDDYVEELFHCMNEAVAARLRSDKPVSGTLSGGLDSGTVCYLAAEQLAKEGKRLKTFSHVPLYKPSESLPQSCFGDERPFIAATAEASGHIDTTFLASPHISPIQGIEEAVRMAGEPFHGAINAYWLVDIFKTAEQEGFGSLLTGEFGNATISWTGIDYALPFSDYFHIAGAKKALKNKLLRPMLYGQTPLAYLYKRLLYGKRSWHKHSFCHPSFEKRLDLENKIKKTGFDTTFKFYFNDPKEPQRRIIRTGILRFPYGTQFGCETGLEFRDPTSDPQVVTSALSIPNAIYVGHDKKQILRTMMHGRLPDKVLYNPRKGRQSADIDARIFAHRDVVETCLARMKKSTKISSIIDVARLCDTWGQIFSKSDNSNTLKIANLLRTVVVAFLFD